MFKMLVKDSFRDKGYMFWALLWPIILYFIYSVTIGNIMAVDSVDFSDIKIAIVEDEFKEEVFKNVGFTTFEASAQDSEVKLENKEIDAYITKDNVLYVNGFNENVTIIKEVLRKYDNSLYIAETTKSAPVFQDHTISKNIVNREGATPEVIFYFGLVSLFILTSTSVGIDLYCKLSPNKDSRGVRLNIVSKSKIKMFFEGFLSTSIIHILVSVFIAVFVTYVIKIPFEDVLPELLLLIVVGTFFGISFGIILSAVIRLKKDALLGIAVTINLLLCFFSGMMNIDILYYMNTNFKTLSYFNPANLISKALQGVYYYRNLDMYFENLGVLTVMTVVCFVLSVIIVRRRRYESV